MIARIAAVLLLASFGLMTTREAHAHELRPAYLEIQQTSDQSFSTSWKVPAKGDRRLALYVNFPGNCDSGVPKSSGSGGAIIESWQIECVNGLFGKRISVDGLSATLTDALVRLEFLDGRIQLERLTPEAPSLTVGEAHSRLGVSKTYFILGVEHILLGVDHLLFVFALLLIVPDWRRLLYAITSFTIAHSITLVAATLGFVWLPGPPVEAVIALSIMFLASELARSGHGDESLTASYPWVVAFTFGLLHGLGFAGALAEVGLPQIDIPMALLMFNVGVEAGQLIFVTAALSAMWLFGHLTIPWPAWAQKAPAYGIGILSAFWFVERVAGFWI